MRRGRTRRALEAESVASLDCRGGSGGALETARYDGCPYYESLAKDLAGVKQRLTHLETMVQLLEPSTPYSQYLARGEDGTVIAIISVLTEAGRISAAVTVPLRRDTPPFDSFLLPYLEERKRDGLVIAYTVSDEGGVVERITVTVCTDDEVKTMMIKELLGKLRWTLAKMHRNEKWRRTPDQKEVPQRCR